MSPIRVCCNEVALLIISWLDQCVHQVCTHLVRGYCGPVIYHIVLCVMTLWPGLDLYQKAMFALYHNLTH